MSFTVTLKIANEESKLLSTTNKVSTLFPILEQLKLYFDKVKLRLFVQSSLDPLLIWLAVTVAFPLASRVTVWLSFAIAIGGLFTTVTWVFLEWVTLLMSSTSNKTVIVLPTSLQSNVFGVTPVSYTHLRAHET